MSTKFNSFLSTLGGFQQPPTGPLTPQQQMQQRGARNRGLSEVLYTLSDVIGDIRGQDIDFQQRSLGRQRLREQQEEEQRRKALIATLPKEQRDLIDLFGKDALSLIYAKPSDRKIIKGADGFNYYADTGDRVLPEVQGAKSSVSDPLRTITMDGKVIKNVRDSELTPDSIKEINESGQVIQPLGFTEKFESTKDVDFAPIKEKYLATENIIIKTSELAEKFAAEPSSALAVGRATQFVDGIIKNIDAGGEILNKAKDTKVYEYMQNTSTSLEGKDFSGAIAQASKASGVAESRIRDLAYLFAAARGQTGRGLSDKDYENALKIVTGGVGAEGRIAVLQDVATGLRDEYYRAINFDISTSENEDYVNKLKGLPQLPNFINPFTQPQTEISNTNLNGTDPLGIR